MFNFSLTEIQLEKKTNIWVGKDENNCLWTFDPTKENFCWVKTEIHKGFKSDCGFTYSQVREIAANWFPGQDRETIKQPL